MVKQWGPHMHPKSLHVFTIKLNKGIQDNGMIREGELLYFLAVGHSECIVRMLFHILIHWKHAMCTNDLSRNCKVHLSIAYTGTVSLLLF